jgi:hypothetical protein
MLIYTAHITARISYMLHYFNERFGVDASLTDKLDDYLSYNGAKLNYSEERIDAAEYYIKPIGLLQQDFIRKQKIQCFEWNGINAFFQTEDDLGFDVFAAVFFLITRYEEYTEHEPDEYGRYAHWNSLAWKEGFLHKPLVDIWMIDLGKRLQSKFSSLITHHSSFITHHSSFIFLPTYDIDIAWSYKHKGFWRNVGALLSHPSTITKRISVLSGKAKDPFDSYEWIHELHQQHALDSIYFFLVAREQSEYDKNISPAKPALQQLIRSVASNATIGLHPSVQSNVNKALLAKERDELQRISRKQIKHTRSHYIRFHLPHSFRELISAGFTDEYSMGYGTVNGFRASTCHSYLWYDLENEKSTSLRVHPFAYMEANSFYELHHSPEEALDEMKKLCGEVKKVNGTFITIFHNHMLGTDPMFQGWKEMYQNFVEGISQRN